MLLFLRNQKIQFALLQWAFWSTWSSFASFYVFYFSEQGYSSTNIGLFLSIMTLMGLIGQLFWGYICDLKRTIKRVFIFCITIIALIILLFPYYQNAYLIMLAMGGIGFLWTAQQSIIDSWILQSSTELRENYGFTRAWGSLGFALIAVIFGKVIQMYGWNIIFIGYPLLSLLIIIIASKIEDGYQKDLLTANQNEKSVVVNPFLLFKNFEYIYLLIIATLIFMPNTIMISFLPMFLKNVGGTTSHQGLALFFIAISEVPTLLLSKQFIIKYNYRVILLFSAIFYIVRLTLLSLATSPAMIIGVGMLQALSFAVFLPTVRYSINQIAPDSLKTTAQTFATCSYLGLGGVLANSLGGVAIDYFGVRVLLYACIGIIAIVIAILLVTIIINKEFKVKEVSIEESLSKEAV
ncbi:PPP family 3-phenylpropionic acid transporter [Orenia metallireducens]|uniref:MFS transporter, PPP family, 3-phenylpropionic acid transporter n=1 Tax=Orenia metallireducens TaxID=1413210 RepID=A0A285GFA9_9FIRM|nr:MFS transporter [Orenia metallireducens]PRX32463.1 PPP family 3-phenylpropionic acid transporter [Orenia metallireducens]SNY21196.1 MFS transporter, PPP family, 3-phenylpropionic acid transporter [Orenia metallireducens]